jgi:hypothetical protein
MLSSLTVWDVVQWVAILFVVIGVIMLVRAWLSSPRRTAD